PRPPSFPTRRSSDLPNPRQFLPPPRQLVAAPRQLLLRPEQLKPRCKPLFKCPGRVLGHRSSLLFGLHISLLGSVSQSTRIRPPRSEEHTSELQSPDH